MRTKVKMNPTYLFPPIPSFSDFQLMENLVSCVLPTHFSTSIATFRQIPDIISFLWHFQRDIFNFHNLCEVGTTVDSIMHMNKYRLREIM